MLLVVLLLVANVQGAVICSERAEAVASSEAGGKYVAASAVDGNAVTRWASKDTPSFPQWFEVRLKEPAVVDSVLLSITVNELYSDWNEFEISFSEGPGVRGALKPDKRVAAVRFEPRRTEWVRVSVLSVHNERHYVGIDEILVASDADGRLAAAFEESTPLSASEIAVRGRKEHPCVNVTPNDVKAALERIEKYAWARQKRDEVVADANRWLENDDGYWLQFLPEPGACYAYGFTGDPETGAKFGTWGGARCDWEHPRQVANPEGRWFPNDEFPDAGKGYTAPDGRVHYFVGVWNAWVTEQWTLKALPALSQAYLLTGDERYAERGVLFLDALASIYAESTSGSWDYPSEPPSGRFARPWYQVARMLVKYVDHYDFLYNSPAMEKPSKRPGMTRRENIEQYMLLDGAYYCYEHSFEGSLTNGHADYLRGALAVGCLLDIPEYVRKAVDSAFSIRTMLANNIDRDGRYYETSPGYAIHARLLYLTYADPLLNLRNAEYPNGLNLYDDPKMQASLLLPEMQIEVAGRQPNFGDCGPDFRYKRMPKQPFSKTDYLFLERLYAMTSDPAKKATYAAALQYVVRGNGEAGLEGLRDDDASGWLLWHAADAPDCEPALPPELEGRVNGSWVAGMKGLAILRSGEQAVVLRYGPSLTHGDQDDLGLQYYANGYELSYDIGYGLGSTHCTVGWASNTVSHCLVTVDETSQLKADGSGGSLRFFGDLPGAKVVEATSELSYAAQGVSEYRRMVALLTEGGYVVDVFRVAGGRQHDFGFGSIGTDLEPFGVADLKPHEGSLAEGVAWGQKIGNDGDIVGFPNKPYWNAPPGNGYGFFFDVRRGKPEATWGGTWSISGEVPTKFRMHVIGDANEAIIANAPGLYPTYPLSSYVMARRKATTDEPLRSTFIAVYEPFAKSNSAAYVQPVIKSVGRLGSTAVEVRRVNGACDIVMTEAGDVDTSYGPIRFDGDFALLEGDGQKLRRVQTLGAKVLEVAGKALVSTPGVFEATVVSVDLEGRTVTLDKAVPNNVNQLVAVFSNPAYSRTTAYHILQGQDMVLRLQAGSLSLGKGRVQRIEGPSTFLSDITHEYAKSVTRRYSTRFFDGRQVPFESGATSRIVNTKPGTPFRVEVSDLASFRIGDTYEYIDLTPGDAVTISLPQVVEAE